MEVVCWVYHPRRCCREDFGVGRSWRGRTVRMRGGGRRRRAPRCPFVGLRAGWKTS
jgi:hypothetical protein